MTTNLKLSIIIPCYNCEKTLEEAVASCYAQGLDNFEIVLVEDCSTDNTKEVIDNILKKYKNISAYFNQENKGGGYTRNKAVEYSKSEVIFCLDSDDMLPPNTLAPMLTMLMDKNCDGVGLHHSTKFLENNINNIQRIDTFSFVGEKIPFESLLEKNNQYCPLYSVFMFTKKAFKIAGGYPIEHGFDTQGFAWRFLCHGLIAYTCPNTNYLHRITSTPSYYVREYNDGKINRNWQIILDEFIFLFTPEVQRLIIEGCKHNQNLFDEIKKISQVFVTNTTELIEQNIDRKSVPLSVHPQKIIKRNSLVGIYYRTKNKLKIYKSIVQNRDYNIILLYYLIKIKIKSKLKIAFLKDGTKDNNYIDIVIPTILKDEIITKNVIDSTKFIKHKINKIFLICPKNDKNIAFCKKNNCIFIDEDTVTPYTKQNLKEKFNSWNRSNWIFQQLLKLGADSFVTTDSYITLDDDTIFISPQDFIRENKFIIRQSIEWNKDYYDTFTKIFKYKNPNYFSSVCHMMIFNKSLLNEMKKEIENTHKDTKNPWFEIIIKKIDTDKNSCFSEFETYSNWLAKRYSKYIIHEPFYNINLNKKEFISFDNLVKKYNKYYTTVSFQEYENK